GGGAAGAALDGEFRRLMTVTLANQHPMAELNTSFLAWVSPSSIRSGEQQDELLENGYIQLDYEIQLGSAFTLVPGTFVYGGAGTAGATTVRLPPTRQDIEGGAPDPSLAVERTFSVITPDAILVFSQPPVSCESVAFYFTIDGDPLTSEPLTGVGDVFAGPTSTQAGLKTLAQIDAYQCDPFRPGLFLRIGGGALPDNEFFEGQDIRIDFSPLPNPEGYFGVVIRTGP
ncbi:MAG: hypothetical protein KKI02_05570, partial [Planctomycetes bacterium]|nr:hypothetical protein [Planctomycetota bacterium]